MVVPSNVAIGVYFGGGVPFLQRVTTFIFEMYLSCLKLLFYSSNGFTLVAEAFLHVEVNPSVILSAEHTICTPDLNFEKGDYKKQFSNDRKQNSSKNTCGTLTNVCSRIVTASCR